MKKIKNITIALAIIIAGSCTQEEPLVSESQEAQLHATQMSIKEQVPQGKYDHEKKGLYHGLFVAGYSQERGKLWINMANDGTFMAQVEMTDGRTIMYHLNPWQEKNSSNDDIFRFVSESRSSFYLDLNDLNNPVITNAQLEGNLFFGAIAKKTTSRTPMSFTGTFEEIGNPSYSGTWSFIADGSNPDPNGSGSNYEGLTEVIITIDGNMYTDEGPFENTSLGCLGEAIPTLSEQTFGLQGAIKDQISNFTPASESIWSIEFSTDFVKEGVAYYESDCSRTTRGVFTTTWQDEEHTGVIRVDE